VPTEAAETTEADPTPRRKKGRMPGDGIGVHSPYRVSPQLGVKGLGEPVHRAAANKSIGDDCISNLSPLCLNSSIGEGVSAISWEDGGWCPRRPIKPAHAWAWKSRRFLRPRLEAERLRRFDAARGSHAFKRAARTRAITLESLPPSGDCNHHCREVQWSALCEEGRPLAKAANGGRAT